jgi:hypothetical protein
MIIATFEMPVKGVFEVRKASAAVLSSATCSGVNL